MIFKKRVSVLLAFVMLLSASVVFAYGIGDGYAKISEHLYYAEICFCDGVGPEKDGYTLDYRYFSPVKVGDATKYPLVIWLHGFANGSKPGYQLEASDIEAWGTEELQKRFKNADGAFILAPRSLEEENLYWDDCLISPLCATIEDFIAKNKDNIDLQRIYIGGHSMGGLMTLKMAVAYPEMFAAIFPVCPAWTVDSEVAKNISDIPMWLTSSKKDTIVSYNSITVPVWNSVISESNIPEKCRFSTLSTSAYPDGELTSNEHQSWFSVNYDMFSSEDSDYPYMSTIDGNGNAVELSYPDGMISWLSEMTSDYDGSILSDNETDKTGGNAVLYRLFVRLFTLYEKIVKFFESIFG